MHNNLKKIHIFYKILGLLQWDEGLFCKGQIFFCGGVLRPRPWAGPDSDATKQQKLCGFKISRKSQTKVAITNLQIRNDVSQFITKTTYEKNKGKLQ